MALEALSTTTRLESKHVLAFLWAMAACSVAATFAASPQADHSFWLQSGALALLSSNAVLAGAYLVWGQGNFAWRSALLMLAALLALPIWPTAESPMIAGLLLQVGVLTAIHLIGVAYLRWEGPDSPAAGEKEEGKPFRYSLGSLLTLLTAVSIWLAAGRLLVSPEWGLPVLTAGAPFALLLSVTGALGLACAFIKPVVTAPIVVTGLLAFTLVVGELFGGRLQPMIITGCIQLLLTCTAMVTIKSFPSPAA